MTEIPEHLLRRSKERREALGLGGGGGDAGESAPAGDAPAASPASEPDAAVTPAAPAPAPVEAPPPPPPPPPPPYVVAAQTRPKIPAWALPVLAILPIWGFVYAGSLAIPEEGLSDPELVLGEKVYGNCSGCHGAKGEGGAGRPLGDGDVLATFPEIDDHVAWVTEGSALVGGAGNPYGDPARAGGPRISGADGFGQMAGFGGTLSEEEILAVVRYEREVLSGGEAEAGGEGGEGGESEGGEESGSEGGESEDEGGESEGGEESESEDEGGESAGST